MSRSSLRAAEAGAGGTAIGGISTSSVGSVEAIRSELGATETARGTVVALPGDVLFDFDKADIRPDARPTLDKVAQLIAQSGGAKVAIEGHSDSKGEDGYNQKLSERRAMAVRDYLKDVRMIPGDRLEVRGFGELRPVAANLTPDGKDDPAGQRRNRRVEVIIAKTS
ncbi:OmpA family protein [Altererythrobacter aerius]|uniref:OmpA family protein n=1 Tax=Tsuneonella aeria TaxID=1837929 RepID=A0A6I4TDT2_9SPHN|nr:OmpA family protein [Tsuneonella aeria]